MSVNQAHSEKELLLHIAEGNEEAFRQLFLDMYPALHQFVWRILGSEAHAKDLVSDVFLQVWENRHDMPAVRNIRPWLYTLARNRAINYLKKTGAEEGRELKASAESSRLHEPEDPLQAILDAETLRQLQAAIGSLPRECAKVMELVLQGHTTGEIAVLLDISPSAVSHQKTRAIKLLKEQLSSHLLLALVLLSAQF